MADYREQAIQSGGLTPNRRSLTVIPQGEILSLTRGILPGPVEVAYEAYGQLNEAGDNAALVCHALTGDTHVASHHPGDPPGWWEGMVGEGCPLDPSRLFVVCINVLGGCSGTTGPWSLHPGDNRPYGTRFPVVTVEDMVHLQKLLLDRLGVRRLRVVTGGSLGGMQALRWPIQYPEMVKLALPIAAPLATSAQSIAYNEVMRRAIMIDPRWEEGRYDPDRQPVAGMAVARMLGMITYQSHESMEREFGRQEVAPSRKGLGWKITGGGRPGVADGQPSSHPFGLEFEVESYLRYHGTKLVQRFDANTYLYLTKAMDLFDARAGFGSTEQALRRIRCPVHVVGITSDILYPHFEQVHLVEALKLAGAQAHLHTVTSPWGHDAFLIEFQALAGIVEQTGCAV